jgi:diacylglycerol kinase (ATP)
LKEIILIANFGSRATERQLGGVQAALIDAGVRITASHAVARGRELTKRLRAIVKQEPPIIAVAGGDGSMTRAAAELVHRRSVLAVLPLGTGNSFARSLGIPDVQTAVSTIATGKCCKIDVGIVNGRCFANFATIGLTSEIAAHTPDVLKRIAGVGAYVLAGLVPALRDHRFHVKIKGKNVRFQGDVHQVIVASGRYFGETPLLPTASVTSGNLAVFTTTADGVPGIAKEFLAVARGRQTELEQAHWWTTSHVKITSPERQLVAIDGKPIDETPARFKIDRKALRVLVPLEFDGLP